MSGFLPSVKISSEHGLDQVPSHLRDGTIIEPTPGGVGRGFRGGTCQHTRMVAVINVVALTRYYGSFIHKMGIIILPLLF